MNEYVVKRGDSLWKIAKTYPSYIAGNTTNAKIDTLVALNGIKNRNLITVGQVLKFSGSASGTSSSSAAVDNSNKVNITTLGLQSSSTTGRDFFASWIWTREHTANYKIRWEWDYNGATKVSESETKDTWSEFSIPDEFRKTANWVQIFIKPVSETYEETYTVTDKNGNKTEKTRTVSYWTDAVETGKQYFIRDNPPLQPPMPDIDINKDTLVLTASISNIVATDLDATGVKFNIVQDNSVSIATSDPIPINTTSNYVSWQYTVQPGHTYTVRACSVSANGKESGWSDFSGEEGTRPSAPTILADKCRRNKRTDGTVSAYIEWTAVPNATSYKIEYVTIESDFYNTSDIPSKTADASRTSLEITDIETGKDYFFRVKAVNDDGESDPTAVVMIPIGSTPAAPTTWSSSESAFVGKTMELNWMHNPTDNSKQTFAQLVLIINDSITADYILTNTTDVNTTGEEKHEEVFTYGTAISYKGELYFKMDTNHADLENAKIKWKVRTAGVTDSVSDSPWSTERTIYIYEEPTLALSVTSDLAGTGPLITTLTTFPFYVRGKISLTDFTIQRPVGYHLQIVSNNYYVTVDDVGKTKTINPGDTVYSKYFDTSDTLVVEMSANNLDLESGMQYTIYCNADMSTGLSVGNKHDFTVSWVDVEYAIAADISVNDDAYTALITPYCREKIPTVVGEGDDAYTTYEDGDLVDNVTLAVYRREYDGSYKEIASGIPNNYTAVTDPHPALDFARYRFTAKDKTTGALSFWDMAGYPVNGSAVIIQWAEEWSTFDVGVSTAIEGPAWSGSLLKLPYNIKITDSRKREKTLVEFAGREHPVTYYGTQLGESSTWNVDIPADDKETIYALRRLSLWSGDVYVREPSGMGFWATVEVSFNKSYDDVKIPITLNVTRVEGGV